MEKLLFFIFVIVCNSIFAQTKSEILDIFKNKIIYTKYSIKTSSKYDSTYIKARKMSESYTYDVYDPALKIFQKIICKKKDKELFRAFINVLIEDSTSADETPGYTLFEIFKCQSNFVISEYKKSSKLEKLYIHKNLEMYFEQDDNNLPNFSELKKQFNTLK